MTSIAFCLDGCTISVGTSLGRVVAYNLKDVKKSKVQLQYPTGRAITALAFQRPVKTASSKSNAAAPNQSQSAMSVSDAHNQSMASANTQGNSQRPPSNQTARPPPVDKIGQSSTQ